MNSETLQQLISSFKNMNFSMKNQKIINASEMSSVEASIAHGLNVLEHSIYCCNPECEFFKCSNMKW